MSSLNQFILEFAPKPLEAQEEGPEVTFADIFSDRTHVDRVRPLRMLQLSKTSLNALEKGGILSTGGAYDAWRAGQLDDPSFGTKVRKELPGRLEILSRFVDQESSRIDWVEFAREKSVGVSYLCFSSPHFSRLHPAESGRSIGSLHFAKAQNPLREQGWDTIGKLLEALESGIQDVRNLGKKAFDEIVEATFALADSIDSQGNVDWVNFAKCRGLTLVPSEEQWSGGNEELIALLPQMARETVVISGKDKELPVFEERLMKSRGERPTLAEVGKEFGVTRERIRQLQALSIARIRGAIFKGEYDQTTFRFRPEIEVLVKRADRFLEEFGERIWRAPDWISELAGIWEVSEDFVDENRTLLTELLGFGEFSGRGSGDGSLIFPNSVSKETREAALSKIAIIEDLLAETPLPISPDDLLTKCNEAPRSAGIEADEIEEMIHLSDRIEEDEEGLLRHRFDLLSMGEKALRVIVEHGEPLHFNDVAEKIDERDPEADARSHGNRITAHFMRQDGLSSIGRTGLWTWDGWDVETGTVADVAERALEEAGEALPSDKLHEAVAERRPIGQTSLKFILQSNPDRFIELGPSLWALKKWGEQASPAGAYWTHEALSVFFEDFFAEAGKEEVVFSDLRKRFEEGSGYTTPQAVGILRTHPRLEVETHRNTFYARLLTEEEADEKRSKKAKRPVRHGENWKAIHQWLGDRFDDLDGEASPLIDLVKGIESDLGLARHITYSVISASEEFETFNLDGSPTKLCRRIVPETEKVEDLKTDAEKAKERQEAEKAVELPSRTGKPGPTELEKPAPKPTAFPGANRIQGLIDGLRYPKWRDELRRGLGLMTPDNVDLALICAGRAFDDALSVLLEIAEKKNKVPVDRYRDDQGLKTRIDWALRYRLFDDSDELHLLRKERNQHVHNIIGEDKSRAWNSGPLLFGQYVRYIGLVEKHLADFLGAKTQTAN